MITTDRYPNSNKLWSKADEDLLISLAKANTGINNVCNELGRSPMAVILKLRQLSGLELPYPKDMIPPEFSDETLTTKEKYTEHGTRWSQMDNVRLQKDFYNGKTVIELAKVLNRHPHAVIVQIFKLNQKPTELTALYNRAKELLGKKRVVKVEPTYPKYYRHFKGGKYKALMEGKDSETQEPVVIYQALYGEHGIWVRPKAMFYEHVEREDYKGPRFTEITEEEALG